jgi:hypothetical protein
MTSSAPNELSWWRNIFWSAPLIAADTKTEKGLGALALASGLKSLAKNAAASATKRCEMVGSHANGRRYYPALVGAALRPRTKSQAKAKKVKPCCSAMPEMVMMMQHAP